MSRVILLSLCAFLFIRKSKGDEIFASKSNLPFWNHSLPWDQRLDDLLNRLKVDEMTFQLARGGVSPTNGPAPGIGRLQIGKYVWNTECLRGDAQAGNATAFPQALGLAAAFSRDLIFEVANATGYEVRAKHNDYLKKGDYSNHQGLSCFSPVINIMRHPLWGRNQETYGEDPYLTGELAKSFVKGLQGNHPRYILASAGCKHFAAYAGPENYPSSRFSFDAKVSDKELHMTFFPAFKECIKAGTYSIMCSYNSVNGIPACADSYLLTDVLRKDWGFKGYVVSDQTALELEVGGHHYATSYLEAAVKSMKAGCDLDLGNLQPAVYQYLTEAVELGMLDAADLRDSMAPLFYTRLRLGEFDPPNINPYTKLDVDQVVLSHDHQELALKAALKSFVLIKNDGNALPIEGTIQTLAVVGPFANTSNLLFADYAPEPDPRFVTTVLEGLSAIATKTKYAAGCEYPQCETYDQVGVRNIVTGADFVVVCLGTGIGIEKESRDRHDMLLPGKQEQLLQDAARFAAGKPVVLLLFNAGPLNITWALSSPSVLAIVECFFPAQATGAALRMMFQNAPGANPGGRLQATWPATIDQIPPMENYTMDGRTYRYFHGDPMLPFGYGLSYAAFNYSDLMVSPSTVQPCHNVTVKVNVKNIGNYTGDEVTQVYISWQNVSTKMPIRQLVDFSREELAPGKTITLQFQIVPRVMAVYTTQWLIELCTIDVYVGGQQPGQKVQAPSNVLAAKFQITGVDTPLAKCPNPG